MIKCRLCGKRIWYNIFYWQLYRTYTLQEDVYGDGTGIRTWKEYEHDECTYRYPERSLNFKK